jgi:hypothetical protein
MTSGTRSVARLESTEGETETLTRLSGRLLGGLDILYALIVSSHARGHLDLATFGKSLHAFASEAREKNHPNREDLIRRVIADLPWMAEALEKAKSSADLAAAGQHLSTPTIQ